jgi:hypothetical protein
LRIRTAGVALAKAENRLAAVEVRSASAIVVHAVLTFWIFPAPHSVVATRVFGEVDEAIAVVVEAI